MKTFVDIPTGVLVIVPQSIEDRRLLYNLMNCSDLTEFTSYLGFSDKKMTVDLGIQLDRFDGYLKACEPEQHAACEPLKLGSSLREIDITRPIGFLR